MGGSSSKASDQPNEPFQAPGAPYSGPPAQYHFINTQVMIGTHLQFGFLNSPVLTTNVDQYYPLLSVPYTEGYRLLSFYRIPLQMESQGVFSGKVAMGYQGMFCRYPDVPRTDSYHLRIEKSVIQLQNRYHGIISLSQTVDSDTSHVLSAIARNTQDGGRLICIEMTGMQQKQTWRNAMRGLSPLMGVDLFFEVPENPSPEKYIYTCVSVPIKFTVQGLFWATPHMECDWSANLASYLNQGWRLVEIFMDKSLSFRALKGRRADFNSIWFFEKPASRLHDPTPVYNGVVVTHKIKVKVHRGFAGCSGTDVTTNWEPVIQEMGNKGWQLACILELWDCEILNTSTFLMTCKLFFQRPLAYEHRAIMGGASAGPPQAAGIALPPASSEKMGY